MVKSGHTPSFSLTDRDMAFIATMIDEGHFGDRTEVVRAGLRLLEHYQYDMELKRLRVKIEAAEGSIADGKGIAYDSALDFAHDVMTRGRKQFDQND